MGLPDLEKFWESTERLAGSRWAHALTWVLLGDTYLVLRHQTSLLSLDRTWAISNITVSDALLFGIFLLGFLIVLSPLRALLQLPSWVATEWLIKKYAKQEPALEGVKEAELLSYAMINNNSVVYNEYLKQISTKQGFRSKSSWKFAAMSALLLNFLASSTKAPSLGVEVWSILRDLPSPISVLSIILLALTVLVITISGVFAARYTGWQYLDVPSRAVFMEVKEATRVKEEAEDHDSRGEIERYSQDHKLERMATSNTQHKRSASIEATRS